MTDTVDATAPTADATASTVDAAPTWTTGLSEDHLGIVAHKGWESPADVLKSYDELQKHVGRDPQTLITIPGPDATAEDWSRVHQKLGRPNDANGYTLAEREGATEQYDTFIRQQAFDLDLTPAQAERYRERFYEQASAVQKSRRDARTDAFGNTVTTLMAEWGDTYKEKNAQAADGVLFVGGEKFLASVEREGLNADPEFVKAMAKIGELTSEPGGLVHNGRGRGFGKSPGEAKAELASLKMDENFTNALFDKRHPGHKNAVERQSSLFAIAHPENRAV